MRNSKLVAFLLAVILCVVSCSAALAKSRELSPDESDELEKWLCGILRDEGYNVDFGTNLKSVDISYTSDGYKVTMTTTEGGTYNAKLKGTKTIVYLSAKSGYGGTSMDDPQLDKKTMKRVEKKVKAFLKKVNPSLRKKIGTLEVTNCMVDGKKTYVELKDSKDKAYFALKVTSSAVQVITFSELNR